MTIKHTEGYDCIDDNLNVILKMYDIDIRRTFSKLWYFEFKYNGETIGRSLMQKNINKYKIIKDLYNIDYKIYENEGRNKLLKLKTFDNVQLVGIDRIDEIIKLNCRMRNIIIIEVDTYKYKFDKGYKKYIGTHTCILKDIIDNKATILDAWYNLENEKIDYNELLDSITRIVILDISCIKEKKLYKRELKEIYLNNDSINEMKEFFTMLENINLEKEYLNLDFDTVFKAPIDKGLRKIIMNRQRFAYYLYFISERFNNSIITSIGEEMFSVATYWTKIRNILMQHYFLEKNINVDELKELSEIIIAKELKIKERIEDLK